MALPTMTVRIAFDTAPFAAVPTWTTITSDVIAFSSYRGRMHELDRMEAGTAMVLLNNSSGNYWPYNTGGAYYGDVLPGKRINIRATYSGTTYDLYTGFIEAWQPSWLTEGGLVPVTTLQCADLIKNLARLRLNNAGEAAEASGTRVGNVLDELSWPAGDRDLDAGQSTMIATGAQANVSAMEHLFLVQDSEMGIVFIAGDGDVQFQDRHARLKSPYTTSQATFGDDAGEQKYKHLEPSYDDQFIFNDIRVTRSGGTEQTASDATSQTTYGQRSLVKTGLLMSTDADALAQADYRLSRYKDATFRTRTLIIKPDRDPVNLFPKALNYDISTRITVRLNQATIDRDYHIEGIAHEYDGRTGDWTTTWELSDADDVIYWVLGTAGFSELGETTILAY